MTQYFDTKAAAEKVVLTFDFGAELPAGVTLAGGTPQVAVARGTDFAAANLLNGSGGVNAIDVTLPDGTVLPAGTAWLQPVAGGVPGVQYLVGVICTTTDPNLTLERTGILPVVVA